MDDQTEYSTKARPQAATDRTYVARLDFLTAMHLLRLEAADAAVVVNSVGEDHIRIGIVTVPVPETVTEALKLLHKARATGRDRNHGG
ncbi:hypothetical protein [Streptacidiphilus albus]|uniref:hypothetical protein n=1 Tax=Streptacidiphilus albus TaxID=105425 RepID=UPI00054BC659|nr:hypothetical protein [Streptacidiphilus albus]